MDKGESETFLNGQNVELTIRGFDVSENVSLISQFKEVRDKLVVLQKAIGSANNVVMDGRDIGTKVFPDAIPPVKPTIIILSNSYIKK